MSIFTITLAYFYTFLEKLFRLPAHAYVLIFLIISLIATALTFSPAQWSKIQLSSSAQSLQDYARFLQHTQASGNDQLSQRVYENLSPVLSVQSVEIQHEFHEIVFPQERIQALINFWETIFEKQQNAREVNAALAILSYQTFNNEKFQQFLQRWKELEPNDPRLETFKGK